MICHSIAEGQRRIARSRFWRKPVVGAAIAVVMAWFVAAGVLWFSGLQFVAVLMMAVGIVFSGYAHVGWRRWHAQKLQMEVTLQRDLDEWSVDQARDYVLKILRDDPWLLAVATTSSQDHPPREIPDSLENLFDQFETIQDHYGQVLISRRHVARFAPDSTWWSVAPPDDMTRVWMYRVVQSGTGHFDVRFREPNGDLVDLGRDEDHWDRLSIWHELAWSLTPQSEPLKYMRGEPISAMA